MSTYIKTIPFFTNWGNFNPTKDDPKVNEALDRLRQQGAQIIDIRVSVGGGSWAGSASAVYLILYDAKTPIE